MRSRTLLTRVASLRKLWLLAAGSLAIAFGLPLPALGLPVVYTAGGTLGAVGGGGDPIQLGFSTVRITLFADTADAAIGTSTDGISTEARYLPASGFIKFTNRPGGASDLTIPYTPDLITSNVFAPSASPDTFAIDMSTTTGVPGSPMFFVSGFRVSFIDASFFPGTGAGPLPTFDVTGGVVVFGVFYDIGRSGLYPLNNPFLNATPEPGAALLVGIGLAGLIMRLRPAARRTLTGQIVASGARFPTD